MYQETYLTERFVRTGINYLFEQQKDRNLSHMKSDMKSEDGYSSLHFGGSYKLCQYIFAITSHNQIVAKETLVKMVLKKKIH